MDNSFQQAFLMQHSDKFSDSDLVIVRENLKSLSSRQQEALLFTTFLSPTNLLILSILGGALGVDRFMLGLTGSAVFKIILCIFGIGFIWVLIDFFLIMGMTRKENFKRFLQVTN